MSNEPKHTATPWRVVEHNDKNETDIISDDYFIAQAKHYSDDDITFERLVMIESKVKRIKDTNQSTGRANAARIVQCVNACEGMSNEDLEVKVQIQLSNLAYKVDRNAQERDKAESELESLRAENAELIEALRVGRNELERAKMSLIQSDYSEESSTIQSINNALTTLAKYEKP